MSTNDKIRILSKITSFADVTKSLQDIEKYLNKLEESIQAPAESEVTDKDGKTGDIKTTKNTDGSYTFEIRTVDGWKTPVFQEHPISFKEISFKDVSVVTPTSLIFPDTFFDILSASSPELI